MAGVALESLNYAFARQDSAAVRKFVCHSAGCLASPGFAKSLVQDFRGQVRGKKTAVTVLTGEPAQVLDKSGSLGSPQQKLAEKPCLQLVVPHVYTPRI